jgi:hypothetical protein
LPKDKLIEPLSLDDTAIPIDGSRLDSVKLELKEAGITESVISPDLDGLGRETLQTWELRLRDKRARWARVKAQVKKK